MDTEERDHVQHMKERARADFGAARRRGEGDARALQSVAIDLELSLEDCAAALGREDLLGLLGTSWELDLTEASVQEQLDIRSCTAAELDLLTAHWPIPGGVHQAHHSRQQQGRSEYLVAWNGEMPLGSVVLRRDGYTGARGSAAHPEAVEICHLQVREEHRGRGVGTALIAAAEREAKRHGHRVVAMGAADDNPDALRLYERLGYTATGIVDITEYDWVGEDGTVHHEREHDQLLLRRLSSD